jgi:hypothetical protein
MPHENVHKGCSGKKMIGFGRNHGNLVTAQFSEVPGSSNTGNAIADYNNVLHIMGITLKL